MMVLRDPGEVFLMGNNHITSTEKYGFLEKIDPYSLECISRSPNLPSGGLYLVLGVLLYMKMAISISITEIIVINWIQIVKW